MITFLQLILTGVMVGSIYSLVALGFVLIYKSSGIINVAQGQMLMVGAYVAWSLMVGLHLPVPVALLLTIVIAMLIGVLIERLALRPLIGQPILAIVMMTIALAAFLDGMTSLIWGANWQTFPDFIPRTPILIGELSLSPQHIFSFVLAMALLAIFSVFFRFTRIGLAMRATAEDHQIAQSLGVSVERVFTLAWVIAAVVSALGGILLGSINGINLSLSFLGLKVLPVVLLGGLESIPGAIIAGPIIGVLENIASFYVDPLVGGGVREVAPFVVLVLVLMIKPYGLFGLRRIERV